MCGYIITEIISFRRIVHDACLELISDKNIAEKIYDYIMQPIEDYLYDECEYFEMDWISVEEELPEINEYHVSDVVLCYCKGGVYAFSELEENIFGQKCFSCERDDEYHCNPLEVIAWMPLPKFNEEDEA